MCFKYLCRSTLRVCGGFANIASAWQTYQPLGGRLAKTKTESIWMTLREAPLSSRCSTPGGQQHLFFRHSGMCMDGRRHVQQRRIERNGTLEPFCSAGLSPKRRPLRLDSLTISRGKVAVKHRPHYRFNGRPSKSFNKGKACEQPSQINVRFSSECGSMASRPWNCWWLFGCGLQMHLWWLVKEGWPTVKITFLETSFTLPACTAPRLHCCLPAVWNKTFFVIFSLWDTKFTVNPSL